MQLFLSQPLEAGWNLAQGGPKNLDAVLRVHYGVPERPYFAMQPSLRKLLRLGELPETGEPPAGRGTLPKEDVASALDHEQLFFHLSGARASWFNRELELAASPPGFAERGDGTHAALRIAR